MTLTHHSTAVNLICFLHHIWIRKIHFLQLRKKSGAKSTFGKVVFALLLERLFLLYFWKGCFCSTFGKVVFAPLFLKVENVDNVLKHFSL
jgi:hypothetical protein